MSSKLHIKDELKKTEQEVKMMEASLKDEVLSVRRNASQQVKNLKQQIAVHKMKLDNLKTRQEEQEKVLDQKLDAINEALGKIESISKSSQTDSP